MIIKIISLILIFSYMFLLLLNILPFNMWSMLGGIILCLGSIKLSKYDAVHAKSAPKEEQ